MGEKRIVVTWCKKHWVLFACLAILYLLTGILLSSSIKLNDGNLIYPLDDTYIHMAIAKNFAQHGVWGVTKYHFSSSSSSLLWTFLMSVVYYFCNISVAWPIVLNLAAGTLCCVAVYCILTTHGISNAYTKLATMVLLIFLCPLFILILSGMEHTLQVVIDLVFIFLAAKVVCAEKPCSGDQYKLILLAVALTTIRYEGLFILCIVGLMLMLRKKIYSAIFVIASGLLPIVVYGIISKSFGWFFLPNSVVLKGNTHLSFDQLFNLTKYGHIYVLFLGVFALVFLSIAYGKKLWSQKIVMGLIFLGTTIFHCTFAKIGWLFRYEAYLVAIGLVTIVLLANDFHKMNPALLCNNGALLKLMLAVFTVFWGYPLLKRCEKALKTYAKASNNIYQQQYHMAMFVKEYYDGQKIAINDIGAIAYYTDADILDIKGLASIQVAEKKLKEEWTSNAIVNLTNSEDVKYALVYDHILINKGKKPQWAKVAGWSLTDNVICGSDTVFFYVIDQTKREQFKENLKQFSKQLSKEAVKVNFF